MWSRKRFTEQIYKACENVKCLKSMFMLYIIHQQVFCGNYLNVMLMN